MSEYDPFIHRPKKMTTITMPPNPEKIYIIGLDLGQRQDYTALSIIERQGRKRETALLAVRHLQRYELGTSYPAVVADVGELLKRDPLTNNRPSLVIDATGVGAPVVDMFKRERMNCDLVAVTITGGQEVTRQGSNYNVPKRDLVSTVQVLLQSGRLKIAPALLEAETLMRELEDFKVKITLAANDTYGAWREGTHDDLVLSVALACWLGCQPSREWRVRYTAF